MTAVFYRELGGKTDGRAITRSSAGSTDSWPRLPKHGNGGAIRTRRRTSSRGATTKLEDELRGPTSDPEESKGFPETIKGERRAVFRSTKEKDNANTCGRRLEVECPVRHLDESSSEGCEVECLARHLKDDRGTSARRECVR